MNVRFVNEKGFGIGPTLCMDRLPGPGDEIRLGGDWYVVQAAPIRHEPVEFPSGVQYVPHLVVTRKSDDTQPKQASRKGKLFKETPA